MKQALSYSIPQSLLHLHSVLALHRILSSSSLLLYTLGIAKLSNRWKYTIPFNNSRNWWDPRHPLIIYNNTQTHNYSILHSLLYIQFLHSTESLTLHTRPSRSAARIMPGWDRQPSFSTWRRMVDSTFIRTGYPKMMSAPAAWYSLTSSSNTLPVTPTTRFL